MRVMAGNLLPRSWQKNFSRALGRKHYPHYPHHPQKPAEDLTSNDEECI